MTSKKLPCETAQRISQGELLPELLAPAGSYDALCAAIQSGADAVYMGGVAFNARINAKNFTEEELKRGIALAHSYGVKIYIAANTLIYDRELDGFLRSAEHAARCGADALIVADLGAAAEIKKRIPIELHASTQASAHNTQAALALAEASFSRVVCAREMSREDLKEFISVSPVEAEVFVHGALCVSHSGQCLFSSMVGGRSGNRGECAQPCRLPYGKGGKEYPLSLKDLSLARHIPELCSMGVASLKIEGRMKSPEYVRDVTAIWRRLLDSRTAADDRDMKELADIFSRGGFTDGYFRGKRDSSMLGIRSEEQKSVSRALTSFEGITKKIELDAKASVRSGEPMTLTLSRADGGATVCVEGAVAETAINAPLDKETVIRCLSKLGNTPFTMKSISVDLGEVPAMVPISALNALRRSAIEKLEAGTAPSGELKITEADFSVSKNKRRSGRTAYFYRASAVTEKAKEYFDVIFTPLEEYNGSTNGVALPEIIFDSQREQVKKLLADAVTLGAEHVLVSNLGHLDIARNSGLVIHGDIRLNAVNNSTVDFLEKQGFESVILSPELTLPQIRDIKGRTAVCVYGRVPLMVTEKCVGKELGGCSSCKEGRAVLVDRKGARFPVFKTFGHRSVIVNSVPFYMADKASELEKYRVTEQYFIFTTETAREVDGIIEAYKKRLPPRDASGVKRVR